MSDIIRQGYAEKVPLEEINGTESWHLPHHGIYHKKKNEKIRVVFDCGARYKDTSLNDQLLSGPDILNPMIGILCQLCEDAIAIMCDIEKMFYRFRVNLEHRNYLRFLWWKDGNLQSSPAIYRMNVHIFGAVSSPCCANFALQRIALDYTKESICSKATSTFINRDFYVDDGLTSVKTVFEAIHLIKESRKVCNANKREVLDSIPLSERASSIKYLNLDLECLPVERVLGIQWCADSDNQLFLISPTEKVNTRRKSLTVIASLFDPLAFLSPFIMVGKQILQHMCRDNLGWDNPISGDIEIRWNKWISDLTNLESLRIPRCIRPSNQVKIIHEELHHFSDASTVGYGACSHLRLITEVGKVHCSLVIGKSRVAPTKITTIPKLELTAALLEVKMSIMLRRELKYNNAKEYFWTDSQIVLSYVNNDARKFNVFVANCIQQIKEHSDPSSRRYVPTKDNTADLASRGVPVSMLSSSCWLKAPEFLWKTDLPQASRVHVTVSKDDPNVKATAMNILVDTENHFQLSRLDCFSSWYTVQKAISICLNYKNILLSRIQHNTLSQDKELQDQPTSLQNLEDARITILKILQHDSFYVYRIVKPCQLTANC